MKNKLINFILLFTSLFLYNFVQAQSFTMECGSKKQVLTEFGQVPMTFFESDSLHLWYTDESGSTDLLEGEVMVIPQTGVTYYEKKTSERPFIVKGISRMHEKKTLTEGTKVVFKIKTKNNPLCTSFITLVI